MCGIAGYLDSDVSTAPNPDPAGRALVEAMTARIAHRGPDATTVVAAGPLMLGFVHLRVVDPEVGTQPFRSADGRWLAAVNGTIYNHTSLRGRYPLRTGSDCEVVPYLLAEAGHGYRRAGAECWGRGAARDGRRLPGAACRGRGKLPDRLCSCLAQEPSAPA